MKKYFGYKIQKVTKIIKIKLIYDMDTQYM